MVERAFCLYGNASTYTRPEVKDYQGYLKTSLKVFGLCCKWVWLSAIFVFCLAGTTWISGEMERMGNEVSSPLYHTVMHFKIRFLDFRAVSMSSLNKNVTKLYVVWTFLCVVEKPNCVIFLNSSLGTARGSQKKIFWMTGWYWALRRSELSCSDNVHHVETWTLGFLIVLLYGQWLARKTLPCFLHIS